MGISGHEVVRFAGQTVVWVGHWVTIPITVQMVGCWLHWVGVIAPAGHWVSTCGKKVAPHNWPGSGVQ